MSTYWYIDIDAPIKPDADASALGPILRRIRGRDHHGIPEEELLATGIPFHSRWRIDSAAEEVMPPEGWTVRDGVLHAKLFVENLTRTDAELPLFLWLSCSLSADVGDVVGSMNVENDECRGPLLMTEDGVAWCPSTAVPRCAQYEGTVEHASIDRVPPDMIAAERARHMCDVDIVSLEKLLAG